MGQVKDLVRRELTVLSKGLTVGGYLNTVRPEMAPPSDQMKGPSPVAGRR